VNIARIAQHLSQLSAIREPDTAGTTRRAFTPAFHAGRAWLAERMQAAGLQVIVDAGGNLIGRLPGSDAALPPIVLGSHTDTVMSGGMYDGALGVLTALEVATTLRERGHVLRHPLEVVDFLAEESTPLGSLIGSTAMMMGLPDEVLDRHIPDWGTLRDAMRAVGGDPTQLHRPLRHAADIAAYLEVHIEQGPVLEAHDVAVAAVTGIVGIRRADIVCRGRADHAGTATMDWRHDALVPVAELITAAEQIARAQPGCVATVGALQLLPNQSNVVPSTVRFSVEMRSMVWAEVEQMWRAMEQVFTQACQRRQVQHEIVFMHDSLPVQFHPDMVDVVADACAHHTGRQVRMPSGAGHDAGILGLSVPTGMLFVRTKDGRSHCPEEYAAPADIAVAAHAFLQAVQRLDQQL
jgi:N-carbamoyl-L-amino-acid hydrolase